LSAYFLAKSGVKIVIIEKENESGAGCSVDNGGQLSFSHTQPWATKSSLWSFLKAFFKSIIPMACLIQIMACLMQIRLVNY
jgi:glycine/D-amino acid oxidase-like deaminating enzyme